MKNANLEIKGPFAEFYGIGFNPMFVVHTFLTTEDTETQRSFSNGISGKRLD
jgi:hypothetical protein